ncbi:PR5-like receptor kinase [Citrus sinensis]|nr:PR5-like receptor kinase [Citrus sinensis]
MITIHLVRFPTHVSAKDVQNLNCSAPFHCANLRNIGYPFWGSNRPEHCGYPGFELDCAGDVPEITIMDRAYKVLHINNESWRINVAREDYWDYNCPANLSNSLLNFSIFNYASDTQNLTLYYSCPASFMNNISGILLPNRFNCSIDGKNTNSYYFSWDSNSFNSSIRSAIGAYFRSCANSAVIPVWQSTLRYMVNNPNSVNLTCALRVGFGLQWHANNRLCEECKQSNGNCGYIAKTGEFICYCPNGAYSSSCHSRTGSFLNKKRKIYVGVAASVLGTMVILGILLIVIQALIKKKTREDDRNVEAFIRNHESLAPKRYSYSDVKRMTKSFRDKLGQGGYGEVYKGELPDGQLVAVKVLKNSRCNGEEFINEVASISRTSHVNIVTFLGFCYENKKNALIYELMPNGSLDKFIHNDRNIKLEWKTMYQIAIGIARGLEYLHRGCQVRIVHFDIKPQNILLDEDFCPKISDFGLAKQAQKKESAISMLHARGTIGYIAPEVYSRRFGGVSHKSDVYSYGMMIIEMVGCTKNLDDEVTDTSICQNLIYERIEPGNDFQFDGVATEEEKKMAKKMILVGFWCIQTNPSERPSMHKVLEMLADSDSLRRSCSLPFRCGKITASYPFSGGEREYTCGHPSLNLNCENDTATLVLGEVKYRVLNIDQKEQLLRIAKQVYFDGFCPQRNFTIDSTLFTYADGYKMLTLISGCPTMSGNSVCYINGLNYANGFMQTGSPDCNFSVTIPVAETLLSAAKGSLAGLKEALETGFELKWKLNSSCKNCSSCSYHVLSNKGICLCPDGQLDNLPGCSTSLAPQRARGMGLRIIFQQEKEHIHSDKLGQGGYADVYKGTLPDGRLVAVKVMKNLKDNGEEFINEVASISRTSHVNIVPFLGFCYEKKKRALIYEFMPNGSLDQYIYDHESSNGKRTLEWRTVYQIAVGIARGLEYLHRGCNIRIVHLDIKPHNIRLDEDFCHKISDFGLAKQTEKKESFISMLDTRGTAGYIAPEVFCRHFGGVSHKSDVYSYGMMIHEMVIGRKNADVKVSCSSEYFPNAIYKQIETEYDFQLDGVVTEEEKEMAKKMILVSLWCIQTHPPDRPSMTKVVEMLEGSIENLQIPPKPSLSLPTGYAKQSSPTSSFMK